MGTVVLIYLAVGAVAGILAGLLGIGGGLVIVPMLAFCFAGLGMDHAHIMHIALGTSLASIIFTSISSFMAHHRRGAVHWDIVRHIVPGIIAGTLLGSVIAARLSTTILKVLFAIFLFRVAIQLLRDNRPKPTRALPGNGGMFAAGGGIGVVSSLMGIGGGSLSVPFMVWCNIPLHHAIGTSAAIGFPIAVAGTAGYMLTGMGAQGLPTYSIGYIYLPALLAVVSASMLSAPLGVRLAHLLPVDRLKRIFALLLFVVGGKMVMGLV